MNPLRRGDSAGLYRPGAEGLFASFFCKPESKGVGKMACRKNKWIGLVAFFVVLAAAASASAEGMSCYYCGMRKSEYGHSWVVVTYDDQSVGEFCSLHCASVDMGMKAEMVAVTILVGDYGTGKLIDADTAHWVIGGSKQGVMTTRAKWAFATKEAADQYRKEFGGRLADFDAALEAAGEDLYRDMIMIHKKRTMMRMRKMENNQ